MKTISVTTLLHGLCLFIFVAIIQSCQENHSSYKYHNNLPTTSLPRSVSDAEIIYRVTREVILNSSTPIVQKKDSIWERGYEYGWSVGYEDAENGYDYLFSYDDSRKGGKFLDGYINGYDDGFFSGKEELGTNAEDSDFESEVDEFD